MRTVHSLLFMFVTALFATCSHAAETYGPVKTGDSLWVISKDHKPADAITINQVMIATFRANPDAFGGNINWLYVNHTLDLPDATAASVLSAAEADAEVMRQNKAWKNAVDKFVATGGDRRQQLNTILSGQASDDPEIRALREELRALVAGIREERRALQDERGVRHEPLKNREIYPEFYESEPWGIGIGVGFSLSDPIGGSPPVSPPNGFSSGTVSSETRIEGSLLNLGIYSRLPVFDDFMLITGLEYAMLDGKRQIISEAELSGRFDHYHGDEELDVEASLLRIPLLLETRLYAFRKNLGVVAGGGVVFNNVQSIETSFRYTIRNPISGRNSEGSGRRPESEKAIVDGTSIDLRLFAGVRWIPEWTAGHPLSATLELEQSIGDPFGGSGDAFGTLYDDFTVQKRRFSLKLGFGF